MMTSVAHTKTRADDASLPTTGPTLCSRVIAAIAESIAMADGGHATAITAALTASLCRGGYTSAAVAQSIAIAATKHCAVTANVLAHSTAAAVAACRAVIDSTMERKVKVCVAAAETAAATSSALAAAATPTYLSPREVLIASWSSPNYDTNLTATIAVAMLSGGDSEVASTWAESVKMVRARAMVERAARRLRAWCVTHLRTLRRLPEALRCTAVLQGGGSSAAVSAFALAFSRRNGKEAALVKFLAAALRAAHANSSTLHLADAVKVVYNMLQKNSDLFLLYSAAMLAAPRAAEACIANVVCSGEPDVVFVTASAVGVSCPAYTAIWQGASSR